MLWIAAMFDFKRLHTFTRELAFFVTRTKENILLQRRSSHPVDKSTGVRSDQDRRSGHQRLGGSLS